ncbi:unnamed protein product [Litomosoides sigmodontis]|uniref:Uncharacterized protein n=1 Tax=Litomosoides sigmodontis TaxID=42156 RepID=A0A3P6TFD5_LITSI|nr:unnamed protein product [Litomosoides sigmodontis]
MNLSTTRLNDVTPTTSHGEVIVNPDIASTSAQLMPKKGILKRSSSHGNFPRSDTVERNVTGEFFEFKPSSNQFAGRPITKIPKLTLTWSEKNAVAIYGDTTSDEAVTETDDIPVPIITPISTSQRLLSSRPIFRLNVPATKIPFTVHGTSRKDTKSERQTAILNDDVDDDDDDNDDNDDNDNDDNNDDDDDDGDGSGDDESENKSEEMIRDEEVKGLSPRADNEFSENDKDSGQKQHDNTHVQSNEITSNSHIAGKWWFGRSTKNILHCSKWGCTHSRRDDKESGDNGCKYLTPTQQRLKEIQQLKKQLKLALAQLEDKDLHLSELRNQLRDLESMVGSIRNINEQQQLLHHKEYNENCEHEKRKLIEKHEIRVRQLVQEAVDARTEMTKLQIALKELDEPKVNVEVKDAEVMTETTDNNSGHPAELPPQRPLSPPTQIPSSPQASSSSLFITTSSIPLKLLNYVENATELQAIQMQQDLPLQLQAYENEAMAWRMKAAQLEMVLKDQILKTHQDITSELAKCRTENERLRACIKHTKLEVNTSNSTTIDEQFEGNLNFTSSTTITDCYSQRCKEYAKQLEEENQRLRENIETERVRLNECEKDANLLRHTVHLMEEEKRKNSLTIEQMSREIEARNAEVEAANIIATRLQNEIAVKTKAICYLEGRHQVYRNTILDHHLVVKDESTEDWERGFSDPRYTVNVSKRVQTDLTQEALLTNEIKFVNLSDNLEALRKEFSSKESSMLERFQEIEKDLLIKSSLVVSLTSQLEEADRETTRTFDSHQNERKTFQEKLQQLGHIAENVPILQFEIEKLQQERSLMEYRLNNAKEEYEAGLGAVLAESLKKYHMQSNYWAEKVSAANANNEILRNENIALKQSIEELKLRSQLQQADMSNRLTSSINHVSHLKKQLNRSTRDVQVDVHPRVASKYVACRPNAQHKMTDIGEGDLFDEVEERLKVCQGELTIARQQVAVLQQELVDNAQIQELGRYESERQRLIARIAMLEKVEEERDELLELLRTKITSGKLSSSHSSSQVQSEFRWLSEPYLFRRSSSNAATNEIATLRGQNFILAQKNGSLKEELINLKRFIETSTRSVSSVFSNTNSASPKSLSLTALSNNNNNKHFNAFDLASNLTQVQEYLENVITQIDNSVIANNGESNDHLSKSSTSHAAKHAISSSGKAELEYLKSALKKSRREHEALAEQLDRVTLNFQDACRELNLYKQELREDVSKHSHDTRLPRSRSFAEIGRATVDLAEHLRWTEKAGTMFRELNRIRKEYHSCDRERRELRMQLVMLRGELGLAQCQLAEVLSNQQRKKWDSISNVSLVGSANDISLSSSIPIKKEKIKFDHRLRELWDTVDSSSAVFFTACTSISSLNEIICSASEPELAATKFEGVREYRVPSHDYCDFCLLPASCQESPQSFAHLEDIRQNPAKHEEMMKEEMAEQQMPSPSETEHREKSIHEKNFNGTQQERRLSSYEAQSAKNREALTNLEKQIAELEREQVKLAKEGMKSIDENNR